MAHDADQTSSDVDPDRTRTDGAAREGDEGDDRGGAAREGGWRPTPRQLHTLAGALPLALFVLGHLWMQSHALEGQAGYSEAMASRWWDSALLSVLIMVPLAFHGLYGVGLALRGRYDLRKNPSAENWQLALQRITGLLLGAFVVLHVATIAAGRWSGRLGEGDVYPWMTAQLSTTHNGIPWWALSYSLGMGLCAFHLGTGLWRGFLTWKPKASKRDRRLVAAGAAMLALLAFGLGSNVTVHLATGAAVSWPYGPPRAAATGTVCPVASAAGTATAATAATAAVPSAAGSGAPAGGGAAAAATGSASPR